MTNVEFLRQMVFRGKISRWFRRSKYDFLLVFQYNHWCNLLSNIVIGYFRTFSFWLGFPNEIYFGDFYPLHPILTLRILKRHLIAPNDVFWAIVQQHPLRIVFCSLINETSRKTNDNWKSVYFTHMGRRWKPIATQFGNSLYLTEVINRSKFSVDW